VDVVANFLYQFADIMAVLLLSALGLIIILGVLNIINLAHGEFMMMGAYVTGLSYYAGVPLWACFLLSAIAVAMFGAIVEILIVRRFYRNKIAALVATWGLSLIISQGALIVLGPSLRQVPLPAWTFSVGAYSFSGYRMFLFAVALVLVFGLWLFLYKVRLGIFTRATMQDPEMAEAIGIDARRIGTVAFAIGAGLAGLAGGLYAPTTSLVPLMGTSFTALAFITVVVGGGANPLVGALASSALLSGVATPLTMLYGNFIGRAGLLVAALVIIRLMPNGVSGAVRDWRRKIRIVRAAA